MRLTVPRNVVQPAQLLDELLAANPSWKGTDRGDGIFINPLLLMEHTATTITVTIPDDGEASVRTVLSAHVPGPTPAEKDKADRQAAFDRLKTKLKLDEQGVQDLLLLLKGGV